MCLLHSNGASLASLGREFGVSRERARQICFGVSPNNVFSSEHGCTIGQLKELRRIGRELGAEGIGRDRQPIGAFARQRQNARKRGIEWNLKLWDWWLIWTDSGKWSERGRGSGYVMSRYGDKGAYELGNVFIQCAKENNREYAVRRHSNHLCQDV